MHSRFFFIIYKGSLVCVEYTKDTFCGTELVTYLKDEFLRVASLSHSLINSAIEAVKGFQRDLRIGDGFHVLGLIPKELVLEEPLTVNYC